MKIYHIPHSKKNDGNIYGFARGIIREPALYAHTDNLLGDSQPLKDKWQPFEVEVYRENPNAPVSDFSHVSVHDPQASRYLLAVTERVVKELGDVLTPSGEFLPLLSKEGNFYVYHLTISLDVLDEDNSDLHYVPELGYATRGDIFSFKAEKLEGVKGIFKIPQLGVDWYFATDTFKELVEQKGLTGLDFLLAWDSENPDYQDERWTDRKWRSVKKELLLKKSGRLLPSASGEYPLYWEIQERIRDFKSGKLTVPAPVVSPSPFSEYGLHLPPPPPQSRVEFALNEEALANIHTTVDTALDTINSLNKLHLQRSDEPKRLVEGIQVAFDALLQQEMNEHTRDRLADELGILWGEQVVREYGWHWASINNPYSLAVVAPDASLCVYVATFITSLSLYPSTKNGILLLFNLLAQPKLFQAKPGSYLRLA